MKKTYKSRKKPLKRTLGVLLLSTFLVVCLSTWGTASPVGTPLSDGGLFAHDALAYALSPAHIYPFIHDGSSPYIGTDIDIDDCTVGRLYVYNKNTEVLTAIGSGTVISYATTKEALFFLTSEQKIYRTDFTGTNMTLLYQAEQGDIDKIRTFGHILYFIENGKNVIAVDTLTQDARTLLTLPGLSSVLLFDFDKLVYYDAEDNPFYFNFVTGVTTVLADFYEANSLVNFYTAAEDEGIAPAAVTATWSYNDVDFPLPEYPAELGTNWTLPSIQSFFPRSYGGSNQCDGFARYAHDRFFHLYEEEGNSDWHTDVFQPGDYFGATPDQIKQEVSAPAITFDDKEDTKDIEEFFSTLDKGAFVRYVSKSDPTPYNGNHSIVFAGLDGTTGIFAYEANQDGNNGVSYQRYTFVKLKDNYKKILYYVNHSFSDQYVVDGMYHKLCCDNCAAYLRQTHDIFTTSTTTHHYQTCTQCDWSVSEAHTYRNDVCRVCGHIKGSAVINSPQKPMCLQ